MLGTQLQYAINLDELYRKKSLDGDELSNFLNEYRTYLQDMVMSDAAQYVQEVDFRAGARVLETSVQVYGKKVDNLKINTDNFLQDIISVKTKPSSKAVNNDEDGPPEADDLPAARRRQRRVRCVDEDDFFEIDNQLKNTKTLNIQNDENKVSFLDWKLSHCAKSDVNQKRIDVRMNKVDDRDKSRLRDWFVNDDYMLVRETFMEEVMSDELRYAVSMALPSKNVTALVLYNDGNDAAVPIESASVNGAMTAEDEHLYEDPLELELEDSLSESAYRLGCFRNVIRDLVADTKKEKYIKDIPMKPGVTTRPPCPECNSKKKHKAGGKLCRSLQNRPLPSLDAFFKPHVEPKIGKAFMGALHDKELITAYKDHWERVKSLQKQGDIDLNAAKDDDQRFIGFDDSVDDVPRDHNNSFDELGIPSADDADFALPMPDLMPSIQEPGCIPGESDPAAESHQMFKNMESTKDMLIRISKWHESIRPKIALAKDRGVLNIDLLAGKIMESFPKDQRSLSFRELLQDTPQEDVARHFLTCLQLANEGNLLIESTVPENCMLLTRLRDTRVKKLDEYNPNVLCTEKNHMKQTKNGKKACKRPHMDT